MSAVLWGAVAFCLFAVVLMLGGTAIMALRGWRQLKALRRGLLAGVDELLDSVTRVERRLAGVEGRAAELQRAVDRLSRSVAQARVLLAAAREVGDLVGRVRGVVPQK